MRFNLQNTLGVVAISAALLSAPSALAIGFGSGVAGTVVTYTNASGSGTAVLDTEPSGTYPNVAPGTSFITYANGATPSFNTTYTTVVAGAANSGSITFAADDSVTVYVNGTVLGSTGTSSYDTLFTLAIPSVDLTGTSTTFSFVVANTGGGPTGLDFGGTLTNTVSATPEPSSLFLLGTGALGLAGAIRRRLVA